LQSFMSLLFPAPRLALPLSYFTASRIRSNAQVVSNVNDRRRRNEEKRFRLSCHFRL